jgi:hypothetical protein
MNQDEKQDFICIIFAILLIIAIKTSILTSIFFVFFSNIFFTAYSDAKLITFLIFLIVFFSTKIILSKRKNHLSDNFQKILYLILLLTCLLSIASLFSYIFITLQLNLPFNSVSTLFTNGWFDSLTGPFHIHTFKPIFSWWLSFFGIKNLHAYGTGLNFYYAFPQLGAYYQFFSILLLILICSLIFYGIALSQAYKKGRVFEFTYCLLSFGYLKAIVDGGPLWYEFYINLFLFFLLIIFVKKKIIITNLSITLLTLFSSFGTYLSIIVLRGIVEKHFFKELLFSSPILHYSLFFSSLGMIILSLKPKKYLALVFMIVGITLQFKSSAISYYNYANQQIKPKNIIYITSEKKLPFKKLESIDNLYLYQYQVPTKRSLMSELSQYSPLFRKNIFIKNLNCNMQKPTPENHVNIILIGKNNFKNSKNIINSKFFNTFNLKPTKKQEIYNLTYSFNDCVEKNYNVVMAELSSRKISYYVINIKSSAND